MYAQDYIDEVKLRLARFDVSAHLNDPKILTYINESRRNVQRITLTSHGERYGKVRRISLTANFDDILRVPQSYLEMPTAVQVVPLPVDFIDAVECIVEWQQIGVTYRKQARRLTSWEMSSLQFHAWNTPTLASPAYMIGNKREYAPMDSFEGLNLYIFGLETSAAQTVFQYADANTVVGEVWYYAAVDDLENIVGASTRGDYDFVMPRDMIELVIYYAMILAIQNIAPEADKASVMEEIKALADLAPYNFYMDKLLETHKIPSQEE